MKDIDAYLASQQDATEDADLAAEWARVADLYNKKLWHPLTVKLLEFIKHPYFSNNIDSLKNLHTNLILEIETKIKALSLVELNSYVIKATAETDPQAALKLIKETEGKVTDNNEAVLYCKVLQGQIRLHKLKEINETKVIVEEAEKLTDKISSVGPIHGKFYELASDLYCDQERYADYYKTALRFLGCTDISDMSKSDQGNRAFKLGLAALLGDGVYNFGELLAHPVLESLKGTEQEWLVNLLYVVNCGNLERFNAMKPQIAKQNDLIKQQNLTSLENKIRLLCLMEMTFKRPATERQISFEEIAKESQVDVNTVERLVMNALALKLVKGSIDQVDQVVHLTWVQPRVLDKQQLTGMNHRLELWCAEVKGMEGKLEKSAQDILTN